ncbi:XRE family transcriptional regulator [Bacteroides fragilis]|nr:XRE family transcriptional regulator [Bacteroides fragilis]EFR54638.1 peptidase S24-like protein [Bacteroides fragilis 3_1_12]
MGEKNTEVSARIAAIIERVGENPSSFAKSLGYSRAQTIYDILSGKSAPSYDFFKRFANTGFSANINLQWLFTGNGDMFKKEEAIADERPVASLATQPGKGIPLIPIEAMAGALTGEQTVLEYECERYVVPVFKGADFLIPVKGSSMYPKYSSGDIVACQRVPMSDLFFQWNKVYVIDTNQGALIKRIKPGSDKEHVLIVSDNEKYDPFELPISSIHAVALVIGVIRLE